MISIPFSGSKKYSYKNVKQIVEQGNYDTVYEPFGGSCVLSVNLFNDGLVKRAIVNDYDYIFDLYPQYLDYKDWIINECLKKGIKPRKGCGHFPGMKTYYFNDDGVRVPISDNLDDHEKEFLQNLIKQVPKKYWRLLTTGSNFTYQNTSSKKEILLSDFKYFKSYLKTDKQRKYLEVLNQCKIEHLDWRDFFKKYTPDKNSIIILDPPYINTVQGQYKGQFTEEDTIELINRVKEFNCDFILFNHDMDKVQTWLNGFNYDLEFTGKKTATANKNRKDIMAYVKNSDTSN